MASDVAHDFATAGGVSDEDHVVQVDRFDHRGQVVGVVIHVVAVPRLTRAAVTPPIVGDPPQTIRPDREQLVVPRVGFERPTVA